VSSRRTSHSASILTGCIQQLLRTGGNSECWWRNLPTDSRIMYTSQTHKCLRRRDVWGWQTYR
jgi:hypothetical protein